VFVAERDATAARGDRRHRGQQRHHRRDRHVAVEEGIVASHDLGVERSRGANDVEAGDGGGLFERVKRPVEGLTTKSA